MNDQQRDQAQRLLAQQLPDVKKLQQLHKSVIATYTMAAGDKPAMPDVSTKELDEYHEELRSKVDELLRTPYATALYMFLLPVLIEIKETGSKDT